MRLNIALEWFLNPDHLPFIVAEKMGWLKEIGVEVNLIEPKEHYDGFDGLRNGEISIAINEPLHLLEHYEDDLISLGCYFETGGGVLIKNSSLKKLLKREKINVSTPASNEVTNRIGFEIIKRYCKSEGVEITSDLVEFIQTDFYHIKNLQDGDKFDSAWLCFENYEAIEAKFAKLDVKLLNSQNSNYPNFSALDLMTTKKFYSENREVLEKFLQIIERANRYLMVNIKEAKEIYYEYTKESKSDFEDEVIETTVKKLLPNISKGSDKWRELYNFLREIEVTKISESEYSSLFRS